MASASKTWDNFAEGYGKAGAPGKKAMMASVIKELVGKNKPFDYDCLFKAAKAEAARVSGNPAIFNGGAGKKNVLGFIKFAKEEDEQHEDDQEACAKFLTLWRDVKVGAGERALRLLETRAARAHLRVRRVPALDDVLPPAAGGRAGEWRGGGVRASACCAPPSACCAATHLSTLSSSARRWRSSVIGIS
jgi:hypothetical protein